MKPTSKCTLVDLLDKLLDKGTLINADIIISLAGVPLTGIKLRVALAGIETMLDYGIAEAENIKMGGFDAKITKEEAPLEEGERIALKAFGSYWHERGVYSVWRPGYLYLTNKRLFIHRNEPARMLFETSLDKIDGVAIKKGTHLGEKRDELHVMLDGGVIARIHTESVTELEKTLGKMRPPKQMVFKCTKCGKLVGDIYGRYHKGKKYCEKCWHEIMGR